MGVASGNALAHPIDAAAQRTPKSNRGGVRQSASAKPQWHHQDTISSFCDFMSNPRRSPAAPAELGFEEAQALRIHGELLKLGVDIGQTTAAKYMANRRRPPS
jgi:hypothetical protein